MGSNTFDGVFFIAYSKDHVPPRVHAFYGEAEVLLELNFEHKKIRLADRKSCIKPKNAKRSTLSMFATASKFADEIIAVWEGAQP